MKLQKIAIIAFLLIIFINSTSYAKYVFEYKQNAFNIDIDNTPPEVKILSIKNTNQGYEKYANKTHEITIEIKIEDQNEIINELKEFIIIVGTEESQCDKKVTIKEQEKNYVVYEIKINKIIENGELKVKIPKQSFKDIYDNIVEENILEIGIQIDNIAPEIEYKQEILENGKVIAQIKSNEKIRELEGWQLEESEEICSKEFISDIKYNKTVLDLAGNISNNLELKIEKSTYLNFETMAHISETGWVTAENNYVGIMKLGNKYKIESLAFRINENIDKDFFQVAGYAHTYWEKGCVAKSVYTGIRYNCGYNPSSGYSTIGNTELAKINEKYYLQLGGEGVNGRYYTDVNGNNPIPPEIAAQYNYGISAIKLDLKEKSEQSIIYQIFFNDTGWSKTYINGEEATKDFSKPFEGIKIAIIPSSETKTIIEQWDKNIGTYNLN